MKLSEEEKGKVKWRRGGGFGEKEDFLDLGDFGMRALRKTAEAVFEAMNEFHVVIVKI